MSGNGRRPDAEGSVDMQDRDGGRRGIGDAWLLAKALWRTFRGEDGRGRKVRWLFGLLRPYRVRVF
ncbi:MAG TPA: hypothetical protein VNM42_01115, partial [Solirubrobacterales bacterium]|nr:hypothetical protein [Solirubrobacterales bacterium]